MNDELKKLGLRIRPRTVEARPAATPGKITFDDRGNAVYDCDNKRALEHPGLSLVDEEPAPNAPLRPNAKALRVGYDPYESGMLAKKEWKKKRDLRQLSQWIETKRKVHSRPTDED